MLASRADCEGVSASGRVAKSVGSNLSLSRPSGRGGGEESERLDLPLAIDDHFQLCRQCLCLLPAVIFRSL